MTNEIMIGAFDAGQHRTVEVSVATLGFAGATRRVYLRMARIGRDGQRWPSSMAWMAIDPRAGNEFISLLKTAFAQAGAGEGDHAPVQEI